MASLKQQTSTGELAASSFASRNVLSLGQSTFRFFLNPGLMLYLTFFLLRDGPHLVGLITDAGDGGALSIFGINGFVLGPLIAAVFRVFWQIFSRDYHNDEIQPGSEQVFPDNARRLLIDEQELQGLINPQANRLSPTPSGSGLPG